MKEMLSKELTCHRVQKREETCDPMIRREYRWVKTEKEKNEKKKKKENERAREEDTCIEVIYSKGRRKGKRTQSKIRILFKRKKTSSFFLF